MAASTANSTALRLRTGKAPGNPRHTGQTLVLGGSPKWVEQEQNIFVVVRSWTCTSSPITGSYFDAAVTETSDVAPIIVHYKCMCGANILGRRILKLTVFVVVSFALENLLVQNLRQNRRTGVSAPHQPASESRSDTFPAGFRNTSARFLSRHARR